ncbi:MAG: SUMF1/EgtB/PvdO family nonheme iron enzyme [Verrucomicrobiota bacterium]
MKRTNPFQKLGLALIACSLVTHTACALVTIDSVPVGNAGNAADPATGYGAVGYDYGIGKYEVTLNQYTVFLNAVAPTDTYGLYNTQMGLDANSMGIARSGNSGSYSYSVIGSGNRPVTYVSWFDSARFVNWLHNGQPVGLQAAGTTETGAYTLNGALSGVALSRNAYANYGLPSEDEWFKAAYHQPTDQGGEVDGYWNYPTAENIVPRSRNANASDSYSANIFKTDGIANAFNNGYAVTGLLVYSPGQQYLTDVGAHALADSYYGTFDQAGNVNEWNDSITESNRGLRGSSWKDSDVQTSRYESTNLDPDSESSDLGFRVVLLTPVPEPSVVGLIGLGMLLVMRKRK